MLISFLGGTPSRGIPFNRMFTMKNYPHDILPLYAQGYSLSKFLIQQKGRRYFLDYLTTGMNLERPGVELAAWDNATDRHYGYKDLSELQLAWMDWVRSGSASEQAGGPVLAAKLGNPAPYARQASASGVAGSQNPDQRFVSPDPVLAEQAIADLLNRSPICLSIRAGTRSR